MYCDCEAPECGGYSKIVKARKSHKCCECGIDINPGDRYSRCDGIWEGEARSYYTCFSCSQVREKMQELGGGECIAFSCLEEWICNSEELFQENDDDEEEYWSCSINCLVPWLRRGYNGRFELVEVKEND